jgi:transcriptional regulator with XRE-family HTH domain|nr:MAG TPA: repressor protein C2 [Caudoviricetes sp.]
MDIDKLIQNIKWLCKANNIKIYELETQLNASPGYISRLRETSGIDKIVTIAEFFGVTVDGLLGLDSSVKYNGSNKFIKKLIADTYSNKIKWSSPGRENGETIVQSTSILPKLYHMVVSENKKVECWYSAEINGKSLYIVTYNNKTSEAMVFTPPEFFEKLRISDTEISELVKTIRKVKLSQTPQIELWMEEYINSDNSWLV